MVVKQKVGRSSETKNQTILDSLCLTTIAHIIRFLIYAKKNKLVDIFRKKTRFHIRGELNELNVRNHAQFSFLLL